MRRVAPFLAGVTLGIAVGGGAALIAQTQPLPTVEVTTTTTMPATTLPAPVGEQVLLVWTSGGLPTVLAGQVSVLPGVEAVTEVLGDLVDLAGSDGFAVPIDALAIDPETYSLFVPDAERPLIEGMGGGEALLSATSARLRESGPGDLLALSGGSTLTVAGVVDDVLVGAAELVVPREEAALTGISTPRFLLVSHLQSRTRVEQAIRDLVPAGAAVRIRAPGETPFLRHGDAVLPQVLVKAGFGEFGYRRGAGREIVVDPEWVAENVVTTEVPVLGEVTCHRSLIPPLTGALSELVESGLEELVDPAGFAGCYAPRLIASGAGISRHAWGIALDLNYSTNPTGAGSAQDPRLVEVMERWGFGWGGRWLVPDPAHFEWVKPPIP